MPQNNTAPVSQQTLGYTFPPCVLGMIHWLEISTRPDISAIHIFLYQFQRIPAKCHMDAALNVINYFKDTAARGIAYTSSTDSSFSTVLHFDDLTADTPTMNLESTNALLDIDGYCDSNWFPQDASIPTNHDVSRKFGEYETKSLYGYISTYNKFTCAWKATKE